MKALFFAAALATCATSAYAAPASGGVIPRFSKELPNAPGKSLIAVEVKFAPGEASPPHTHAKSGFILAYVIEGTIKSQLEGEPAKVYHAGDTWYEAPGAHHVMAVNMSKTKPARLLAVFVVDSNDNNLTKYDDPHH